MLANPLLREQPDDLAALISKAAKSLGFPLPWVEQDFWATEALRSLASPFEDAIVIFKGGTSLSKAHQVIRRMSFDLDILVVCAQSAGAGTRDKVLRRLTERAAADTGMRCEGVTSGRGTHRSSQLRFTSVIGEPPERSSILLEMGCRGGPDPNVECVIRSYISEYCTANEPSANFMELESFTMTTLATERTLLEKLTALHTLSTNAVARNNFDDLGTSIRHVYDIAMLLQDSKTIDRLSTTDRRRVIADIRERSERAGWPFEAPPTGGFADSVAFDQRFVDSAKVQTAYDQVLELVVSGPKPSLGEVVAIVRGKSELLV